MTDIFAHAALWLGLALLATLLSIWLRIATAMSEIVVIGSMAAFAVLPWLTPRFFRRFGDRPSELEAKFLLLCDGLSDALLLHPCGILRLRARSDGGACSFVVLLLTKMMSNIAGVYPMTKAFGSPTKEGVYTTLMMSTGLTWAASPRCSDSPTGS